MTAVPLTVTQVATRENVSTKTVLRAIARGDLDAWNVGDPAGSRPTWRIDETAIAVWRARARDRRQQRPTEPVIVRPVEPEAARPARKRPPGVLERGRARVTPDMGRRSAA